MSHHPLSPRPDSFAPHIAALAAAIVASLIAALLTGGCSVETIEPGDPGSPGDPGGSPPGGGSDTGAAPSGDPDQLFSTSSPWNTRATGAVDAASEIMITGSGKGSLASAFAAAGHGFDIAGTDDYPDYGVPLYIAGHGTPAVRVSDASGWWGGGFPAVPIPAGATPAIGADHHLSIWDQPRHALYEFWDMQRASDGTWSAGAGVVFDTFGPGYQTTPWALSARAYGGAAIAGAIRRDELSAGVIPHALGIAYPGSRGQQYAAGLGVDGVTQNIASHSDNAADPNRNTASNIPEGARLRLRASVNVAARCAGNRACSTIGVALQKYGAYVVDNAAVPALYAEVLTGRDGSWSGSLHVTDARVWTAADFELLSLPPSLTATPL
jgi:hypothetical protein